MASVNNPDDEENKGQANEAGSTIPVANTAGASSTSVQAPNSAGTGVAAAPTSPISQNVAPNQSQGYVDVSSYLDANREGAGQLADKVAQNLTDQYNTTKSGIDTSAQTLADQVNKGYTPQDSNLVNSALSNPTGFVQDPNNVAGFQKQLNDSYTGPNSWSDLGTLQGTVNDAQQSGNLFKTPGGTNVLAQKVEGNNTSQGINQLDALLLGSDPTAAATIKTASDPFNTLNDYINAKNTDLTGQISNAQGSAAAASQAAQTGLTGAENTLTGNLTDAQKTAEAQRQQYNTNIASLKNLFIPVQQSLEGFGSSIGQDITDPFAGYTNLQPSNNVATLESTASADDFNRAAALGQLSGGSYVPPLNQNLKDQAGSFVAPVAPDLGRDDLRNLGVDTYRNAENSEKAWDPNGTVWDAGRAAQYTNNVKPAFDALMSSITKQLEITPDELYKIVDGWPG